KKAMQSTAKESDRSKEQLFNRREDVIVKLALLNCAVQSYRFETAAKPFPPQFRTAQSDESKDIEALRRLLSRICRQLVDFLSLDDGSAAGSLRNWLSTGLTYTLERRLPLSDAFSDIQCRVLNLDSLNRPEQAQQHQPSLVYKVDYNDKIERRFSELKSGRNTFFGYHGSRADNLHSILSNGLCAHLSYGRQPLYGEGVYLSTDVGVALAFASSGTAQPLSDRLQCVVVAEVIDQPDLVKRRRRRCHSNRADDSNEVDDLPNEYYVVSSSELVIVRYVLLFSSIEPSRLLAISASNNRHTTRTTSSRRGYLNRLINDNRAWIGAIVYLLLLLILPRLHAWLSACLTGGVSQDEAELEAALQSAAEASTSSTSGDSTSASGGDEAFGWGVTWGAD
ncbi:hypothetical protein BOX15_Mlig017865g4, partial [Macrostomum lignano]